eukprot:6172685-Pleurochrysis_carterae.AAC.3
MDKQTTLPKIPLADHMEAPKVRAMCNENFLESSEFMQPSWRDKAQKNTLAKRQRSNTQEGNTEKDNTAERLNFLHTVSNNKSYRCTRKRQE